MSKKLLSVNGIDFDQIDYQIVLATQSGIPLVTHPFKETSEQLGITEEEMVLRLRRMHEVGFIRKVAAAPNHYKLGYVANAMSVWNIPDNLVHEVGEIFKTLPFISHCYIRPRHLPEWDFNLFAMVHGKNKNEVNLQIEIMKTALGERFSNYKLLYSTKILKKTGIRLKGPAHV